MNFEANSRRVLVVLIELLWPTHTNGLHDMLNLGVTGANNSHVRRARSVLEKYVAEAEKVSVDSIWKYVAVAESRVGQPAKP